MRIPDRVTDTPEFLSTILSESSHVPESHMPEKGLVEAKGQKGLEGGGQLPFARGLQLRPFAPAHPVHWGGSPRDPRFP